MKEIRIKLEGENARLGEVPAADVARLLELLERAAARAAAVVLGQPKVTTGRYRGPIERSVHFRLIGIEAGSVVPVLALPAAPLDSAPSLDLEDPNLGASAIEALLDAGEEPSQPEVARALLDLADGLHIGDRYDSITLSADTQQGATRTVKVDEVVRTRLRKYVEALPEPPARDGDLIGILVEADFERQTARLRTPTEAGITVTFSDDQADAIQAALRQRATFRGEVSYDPRTQVATNVRLTELVRSAEQLTLDAEDFWRTHSFAELALRQGAGQPVDPEALHSTEATDEERDAFVAAIADLQ